MAHASYRGPLALGAFVAAIVIGCGGDTPQPSPTLPTAPPTATTPTTPSPTAMATPTSAPSPTQPATPPTAATPPPSRTPAAATSTRTATPTPASAEPDPSAYLYDSYGAVWRPGTYVFLQRGDGDSFEMVTTYEGLRDGSATALSIHKSDASDTSRAGVYDAVQIGDIFEWRYADDCFVRYQVQEVQNDPTGGTPAKVFDVKAMTYAYTGCSGSISASAEVHITWAPPAISSRALTAPVRHGAYHLIPAGWTGPVADSVVPAVPDDVAAIRDYRGGTHPYWRPATVPEGWSLAAVTWGGETDPPYGYSAWYQNEHGEVGVEILVGYWGGEQYPYPMPVFRDTGWVREPRVIDGHHAVVEYSPLGLYHEPRRLPRVHLFNAETRMSYLVSAWDPRLAGGDPTATIEIARSLIPTPAGSVEPATTFRYDTYDLTGAVAAPGSYAFLSDPDDPASVVTTYEGLRGGSANALLIHTSDADGVSRADIYDAVVVGDLFEWRQADDCFVRYKVTEVRPDPTGTVPRKLLDVEWMTYAFTGCSGAIRGSLAASVNFGTLPDLGGTSLTVPVRHGAVQIVPAGWTGEVEEPEHREAPRNSSYDQTSDLAVARTLDFWREPTLPEGWTLASASAGGPTDASYGFCSVYVTREGHVGVRICGGWATDVGNTADASWTQSLGGGRTGLSVRETRVISGRTATVTYSPPGPGHNELAAINVWVYSERSGLVYAVYGAARGSNVEAAIAIAQSLFESPNQP